MDEQNQQQSTKSSKLTDDSLMNTSIDENVQKMINEPQPDPTGVNQDDQEFLKLIIKLLEDGTIDV